MATAERLLRVLDLLQSRPLWTGPELAQRLGVSPRSVRRDVDRLRALGYPVEAARGVEGGYRLGAGRGMPPLLLSDEEAVAVAVSLQVAATGPLTGASEAATRTMAKLDQVMPPALRSQVAAIRTATATLAHTQPSVDGDTLLRIARACRDRTRLHLAYRSRSGTASQRTIEPVRLVATSQRWYLMAWCLGRQDWRTFRLDRMSEVTASTWRFAARDHPDPVEFVHRAITEADHRHQAVVRMAAPADQIRQVFGVQTVRVVPDGPHACLVHAGADDPFGILPYLLWAGVDFEILSPAELAQAAIALADRLRRAVPADGDRALGHTGDGAGPGRA